MANIKQITITENETQSTYDLKDQNSFHSWTSTHPSLTSITAVADSTKTNYKLNIPYNILTAVSTS